MRVQLIRMLLSLLTVTMPLATSAITLLDAIDSALNHDPVIRASKLNLMATEEGIAIAESRFLPQVSLQGTKNQLTQTTTPELASGGTMSRSFTGPSVNHQLVIRQGLIHSKELAAINLAKLQTEYMAVKYKSDLSDLKTRVVNAWIDLLGAQQIMDSYEKPLQIMKAFAEQEKAKYANGDGTKDSVIEAYAQYQNAKALHIQAIEVWKAKQNSFEKLTRLPAESVKEKKLPVLLSTYFFVGDKSLLWEKYKETSLDLQMAQLQEKMQMEKIKMTEADHKPTVDLVAALNLAQNDATSTQGYRYRNKQVGVQYTLPLFAGGGIDFAVKQVSLQHAASVLDTEALVVKLENEFDNTWSFLMSAEYRQKALNDLWNATNEQAKGNIRAYELGIKTLADSANSEQLVARRYIDLIMASQDYMRNIFKINKDIILNLN